MALAAAFRLLVQDLAVLGLDPTAVCGAAGVDPRRLTDPDLPFSFEDLGRVLAHAEQLTGDAHLGLRIATRARRRGVLAHIAESQRTVGEGLEAFARFAAVTWGRPDVIRIARAGARVTVHFDLAPALPIPAAEFLVARTAILLRASGVPLREVSFRHPARGGAKEHERVLGTRVRFGRPETTLVCDARALDEPLRTANPEAAAVLAAGVSRAAEAAPAPTTARVFTAIDEALTAGRAVDRETIARALAMSGRTLARRLLAEGQGFREILDAVRRALAHRLVVDDRMPLAEVAARLGFSDQPAFGKAFRRWFGRPPGAVRPRVTRRTG